MEIVLRLARCWCGWVVGIGVGGLLSTSVAEAVDFELVEPGGFVSGHVDIGPGRMIIFENTGERLYYSRDASFDSTDGRYVGYFHFDLNRVLRFPRDGSGRMMLADLDDFRPHYVFSRRHVQRAGRGGRPIIAPPGGFVPGGFVPGGFVPGGFVPGGFVPGGFAPGGFIPGGFAAPSLPLVPQPQSIVLDRKTIANPPLEPVRVVLRNGGPRDVQVGVVDSIQPSRTRTMRLPAGGMDEVLLQRDAGGREIQNVRVITPAGDVVTREVVHEIPPRARYEIVVHEWQIQSVAIDRTAGAGANPIEDINFSGRGLGRFPLPPGQELRPGQIDVYAAARSRGNGRDVSPILAEEDDAYDDGPTPLERAILDAQRGAQRANRGQ